MKRRSKLNCCNSMQSLISFKVKVVWTVWFIEVMHIDRKLDLYMV